MSAYQFASAFPMTGTAGGYHGKSKITRKVAGYLYRIAENIEPEDVYPNPIAIITTSRDWIISPSSSNVVSSNVVEADMRPKYPRIN